MLLDEEADVVEWFGSFLFLWSRVVENQLGSFLRAGEAVSLSIEASKAREIAMRDRLGA